jgi:hypothetical protein
MSEPIAGYTTAWTESFDNGAGMFSRYWGPGVDFSVDGQVTVWTDANNADSGIMVPPTGAADGYGYGLYSFTLEMQGTVGVYALTWPATDVWPGPELDIVEIDNNGAPYSTIHWKDESGGNAYSPSYLDGVDPTQVHTYSMAWEEGRLTGYVDGVEKWTTTENVPKDYAHGGENTAPGFGTQTWWNDGALGGSNYITVYDASYAAPDAGGVVTPPSGQPPAEQPPPVEQPPVEQPPVVVPPAQPGAPTVWDFNAVSDAPASSPKHLDWHAGDKLDLSDIPTGGALHFEGLETGATNKAFGIWQWNDGSGVLRVDVTGDSKADFSIDLPDGVVLTATDLILTKGPVEQPPAEEPPVVVPPPVEQPPAEEPPAEQPPVEQPPAGEPADRGAVTGGSGKDTIQLNHVFHFDVDGGAGKDIINLGADHGDVSVIMNAGEVKGDLIGGLDFSKGDVLEFRGYSDDAAIKALGNGTFRVTDGEGHSEKFTLLGVTDLHAGDYVFA